MREPEKKAPQYTYGGGGHSIRTVFGSSSPISHAVVVLDVARCPLISILTLRTRRVNTGECKEKTREVTDTCIIPDDDRKAETCVKPSRYSISIDRSCWRNHIITARQTQLWPYDTHFFYSLVPRMKKIRVLFWSLGEESVIHCYTGWNVTVPLGSAWNSIYPCKIWGFHGVTSQKTPFFIYMLLHDTSRCIQYICRASLSPDWLQHIVSYEKSPLLQWQFSHWNGLTSDRGNRRTSPCPNFGSTTYHAFEWLVYVYNRTRTESEKPYANDESVCFLGIRQWCCEPCFAGAAVSLDGYLLQIPRLDMHADLLKALWKVGLMLVLNRSLLNVI
jgi:hypothetical protein